MSSLLTNTGALTALTNLKLTNQSLEQSSNRVSTGLKVATAKDDAAYWSIATTLRSDNNSVGAVKDALGLGLSTVNTAVTGLNAVGDLLSTLKGKLVEATSAGVDRNKIQSEINTTLKQLKQVAAGASQGGESWLSVDSSAGNYSPDRKIVSSFTRIQGAIAIDSISVDLSGTKLYDRNTTRTAATAGKDADQASLTQFNTDKAALDKAKTTYDASNKTPTDVKTWQDAQAGFVTATATYYNSRDTANKAATAGTDEIGGGILDNHYAVFGKDVNGFNKGFQLSVSEIDISSVQDNDLTKLNAYINLVDKAQNAITNISTTLGAAQKQIESQRNFVDSLIKTNQTSVGILVDADMEEESTKLKALQVQQQLGIQSLTIANTSTQQILSLFRG